MNLEEPSFTGMFYYSHVKLWSRMTWCEAITLVLYIPFGLSFMICRLCGLVIFLFSMASLGMLSHWSPVKNPIMWRIFSSMFGLWYNIRGIEHIRSPDARNAIVTCNHCSTFDVIPFFAARFVHVLVDKGYYDAVPCRSWVHTMIPLVSLDKRANPSPEDKQRVRDTVRSQLHRANEPVLVFPEGWDTSSRGGLLRFNQFLFGLDLPVLPTSLRISTWSCLPLVTTMLGTTFTFELLFLLFLPFVQYDLEFHPILRSRAGESSDSFAKRVQLLTAQKLDVEATAYCDKDALQLRRRVGANPSLRTTLAHTSVFGK